MKKKTGIPEIDAINDRHDGIIRVEDESTAPYAATMTDVERDRQQMVDGAIRALSGEMPVSQGEDKGWLLLGGVHFNQPLLVKDGAGVPLVKITVELMPNLPAEFHTRVLPALIKRDKDGGLLRLTIRFDDDSIAYSNQPTKEQMGWLMGLLAKTGAMKPK